MLTRQVEGQLKQGVKVFKEKDELAKQLESNMIMLSTERSDRAAK